MTTFEIAVIVLLSLIWLTLVFGNYGSFNRREVEQIIRELRGLQGIDGQIRVANELLNDVLREVMDIDRRR